MKFTLRALFILVAVTAIIVGVPTEAVRRQNRTISRLQERDVYIATESNFPSLPATREVLRTPIQAQVRIRPVNDSRIAVLGKELTFDEAEIELTKFKTELQSLGLNGFGLVSVEAWPAGSARKLLRLQVRVGAMVTPCGIDNFPPADRRD